jgi:hypothetical protein
VLGRLFASAVDLNGVILDSHLFFYDRYSDLAEYHGVYYLFLSDLNKIITPNSHLFRPHVPDIDQWIARIEQIRVPRNIVGHMNWLTAVDRTRIDVLYADLQQLVKLLANDRRLVMTIP